MCTLEVGAEAADAVSSAITRLFSDRLTRCWLDHQKAAGNWLNGLRVHIWGPEWRWLLDELVLPKQPQTRTEAAAYLTKLREQFGETPSTILGPKQ